jgi:fused signal recognition particle receptor
MARTLLGKLKRGLFMTHTEFLEKAGDAFRRSGPVAPDHLDRLEEALIASDAGVELSLRLVEALREEIKSGRITTAEELRPAVREQLLTLLKGAEDGSPTSNGNGTPRVTLLVGVNGTGKTTTAAKIAKRRQEAGSTVVLAAADTFRAAAVDQLKVWAERVGAPVVHQQEGADPAAVVFDAIASARSKGFDEVLVDTAGRLHTRTNLMKELEKVIKVAAREVPGAPHEVLLVLDATTGSNGIEQAQKFGAVAGVTGVVLTKLDGTAKGGVILAIADSLGLPVRWVGVGEDVDDLLPFESEDFVDSLLEIDSGESPPQTA